MTRVILGSLALIALLAAIVVGVFAAFGDLGEPPGDPLPGPPVGRPTTVQVGQVEQTAATVGETVTAGDVSWTVSEAYPQTELQTEGFPRETVSGNYVTVEFTVENVSEEPVTLTEDSIVLFGEGGEKFLPEPDRNNGFVPPDLNMLFNERSLLEPGVSREGRVNFELPAGASASVAQLGDTDPTTEEEKYVDLGL